MRFTRSAFGLIKAFAVVLALALPVLMAASAADARVGGGRSYGSRGSHTYTAPPVTNTAPNAARPFDRTMTQPSQMKSSKFSMSGAPPNQEIFR